MSEQSTIMGNLRRFLDVAAGEGYVFDGIDAADLYIAFFGDGVNPPTGIRELERAGQPGSGEAVPEGYALVPIEPTDDMLNATKGPGMSPGSWNGWTKKRHTTIYGQMIRAALAGTREG